MRFNGISSLPQIKIFIRMKIHIMCVILLTVSILVSCEEVNERYIILLKEGSTNDHIENLIQQIELHSGSPRDEMFVDSDNSLIPLVYGNFTKETASMIGKMDIVDIIEKNEDVFVGTTFNDSEQISTIDSLSTNRYNLDLIDSKNCINGNYAPFNYGMGADIYILDTGINFDHIDFRWRNGKSGSRAKYGGYDALDDLNGQDRRGRDCFGHGTHVAGIAAGLYSGVAKDANIYSIRVLNCQGHGSYEGSIKGLQAVVNSHKEKRKRSDFVGSIAGMSMEGHRSRILDKAVDAAVLNGVVVVTSSGNGGTLAIEKSPGAAGLNIDVGAHGYDSKTCKKPITMYSNYGKVVDVLAPGDFILSADYENIGGFVRKSGTSMSCPHVSGVAALMKSGKKSLKPEQIKLRIKTNALNDIDMSETSDFERETYHTKRLYVTPKLVS